MEDLIFLDTHVVVWLYAGDPELFSPEVRQDLEESELLISPIVSLELQYLREIDRISVGAGQVMGWPSQRAIMNTPAVTIVAA